ncbi:MAG: helix-turn-helix domain-containing protein [Alphaproteobacteria bacterium]
MDKVENDGMEAGRAPIVTLPVAPDGPVHRALWIRGPVSEPITATGFARIDVHFGAMPHDPFPLCNADGWSARLGFIGQLSRALSCQFRPGPVATLVVELEAAAAVALAGKAPLKAFSDRRTALETLLGAKAGDLYDRLEVMPVEEAPAFLADWLVRTLPRTPRCRLTPALRRLWEAGGEAPLETTAALLGLGRRQFERCFRAEIGLSPKRYARIIRCQSAARSCAAAERGAFAEIAVTHGYADQAHMGRDFRQFLGMTPVEVRRRGYALR